MFIRALKLMTLIFSTIGASTVSPAMATATAKTPTPTPTPTRTISVSVSAPYRADTLVTGAGFPLSKAANEASIRLHKLTTTQRITQLETATRANPRVGEPWQELGSAYVRQAFETADPAFYPLADTSLRNAERLLGPTSEVMITKANLALARHRFGDARDLADKVVGAQPNAIAGRIALFDADVELGKYDVAFRSIDMLAEQRPNVATLSRLSYRRQLSGDLLGAEIAMRQAVSAAPPKSIDRAIALGYLGDVLVESGRLGAASRSYEQSIQLNPTNSTAALGQVRVLLARGERRAAMVLLNRLVNRNPVPGALGLLSEIARSLNDTKLAKASDELVDASIALFQSNGAVVDAELALLLADRGPKSATAAIGAAQRAYAERRTVFTNDAMAWSLFVGGRETEALPYARAAVAMSPGISSVRWHVAEVFAAVGDCVSARNELVAAMRNPWATPAQAKALRSLASRLGVPFSAGAFSPENRSATVPIAGCGQGKTVFLPTA